MTEEPPTIEEQIMRWRHAIAYEGIACPVDLHSEFGEACDLIEQLVKERDEAKAACEMYFLDADDCLSKAEVFAKVCDELDTKLRAMTARAEAAEGKLAKAREILQWYADENNWAGIQHPMRPAGVCIRSSDAEIERGEKARAALDKLEEK